VARAILVEEERQKIYAEKEEVVECSPSQSDLSKFIEEKAVVRQVFLWCRDFLGRVGEGEVSCPGDTDGGDEGLQGMLDYEG
jgi:hypothetical protein